MDMEKLLWCGVVLKSSNEAAGGVQKCQK